MRHKVLKARHLVVDLGDALFDDSRIIVPVIAMRIDIRLQRTGNILKYYQQLSSFFSSICTRR